MEFNKEEISLCKQVAEKCRIGIKYGEWYWSKSHNKILLALDYGFKINEQEFMGIFKIWTISDCLEFLREKGYRVSLDEELVDSFITKCYGHKSERIFYSLGNTYLEACLKAVLAVLEED